MNYYTADLHFFHKRIVEFTERGKETTVKDHDQWLLDMFSKLTQDDTVYILGDVSFGKRGETLHVLDKIQQKLVFIRGNHDKWMPTDIPLMMNINIGKLMTVLCHYPVACWANQVRGSMHLHGHTHGNYLGPGRSLDVGLESAFKWFGTHRFFSEADIELMLSNKPIYCPDMRHQNGRSS